MARRTSLLWALFLALIFALALVARQYPQMIAFAHEWQTRDMFVSIDDDPFDPGPAIGSHFPGVTALYQGRPIKLLQPLAGPRGLVLAVLESPVESPFGLRQLQQLNTLAHLYKRSGIGLVAISHEAPAQIEALTAHYAITLPLLNDQQTLSFRTLGLLDPQVRQDSALYGRAYPGFIVIDSKGVVVAKLFLADPHLRVDGKSALLLALQALEH
jgi:peroxiredoxin